MIKIKVIISDRGPIFVEGLVKVLGHTPDIEVVGTCSTGLEAIQQSIKLKPDILFLDKHISDCDFVQVVKKIRRVLPQTRIIITQPYKDASPLSAINVEANAYIDKDIPAPVY